MKNQIFDTIINILTSLLGTIVVTLLVVCIPRLILRLNVFPELPPTFTHISIVRLLGFIPIIIGASIILWCYWQFVFYGKGTPAHFKLPKRFVIRGLYRFVRNPMMIGIDLIWFGEVIIYQSFTLLIWLIIGHIAIHHFFLAVLVEEPMLKSKFGETYVEYCKNVPRWIPRLTPYKDDNI